MKSDDGVPKVVVISTRRRGYHRQQVLDAEVMQTLRLRDGNGTVGFLTAAYSALGWEQKERYVRRVALLWNKTAHLSDDELLRFLEGAKFL